MLGPRQCLLILVALVFAVYSPSLGNDFAYDDKDIVRVPSVVGFPNPLVAEVQPIGDYYRSYYGEGVAGLGRGYRPTTVLSWALVHAVSRRPEQDVPPGGARAPAGPQRLVNILLHCLAVWLTFQMLALLMGPGVGAVLGAGVFGLHAVRSDPVLSLVGRGELLGYVFGALALLSYVAAVRRSGPARAGYLMCTALAMFAACTSKESAAPWVLFLPLFVMALRWLQPDATPGTRQQVVPWALGVLVPFAAFLALYLSVSLEHGDFAPAYQSNPLWYLGDQRFATGVMLLGYGLYKVFAPFSLACDYGAEVFTMVETLSDSRFLASFGALSGVLIFGVWRAPRYPVVFLAAAAFFGFAFLVSNIAFPIETIFAERHYYTPALACSLLVAWVANRLGGSRIRVVFVVATSLWCLVCAGVILKRNSDWQSDVSLFAADAVSQPRSIQMLLAQRDALELTDPDGWKQTLDRAYALSPTNPNVLQQLALYFNRVRQFEAAQSFASQGIKSQHPDAGGMRHEIHLQMGLALEGMQQFAAAEKALLAAIEATPAGNPLVSMQVGEFYLRRGRTAEGRAVYQELMTRFPEFVDAREMLLRIALRAGEDAELEALIRGGTRETPNSAVLIVYRAILAERRRDFAQAAALYAQSVPSLPRSVQYAEYWHRYAHSLASNRQIESARAIVRDYLSRPMPEHIRSMFMEMAKRLGM